jgi:hypothetical protein
MRALKFLVVAMGVLIVAATVALVVLLVQRAGGRGGAVVPPVTLGLAADARIVSVTGAGDRLAVLVEDPAGTRVLLLDARTGRRVGEVLPR